MSNEDVIISNLRDLHAAKFVNPVVACRGVEDLSAGLEALQVLVQGGIVERKRFCVPPNGTVLHMYRYRSPAPFTKANLAVVYR